MNAVAPFDERAAAKPLAAGPVVAAHRIWPVRPWEGQGRKHDHRGGALPKDVGFVVECAAREIVRVQEGK